MKKIIFMFLSLFLFITLLSGCATAPPPPIFSSIIIPPGKGKIKIAIKKRDVRFATTSFGFFSSNSPLTNRRVAIYNCIGLGIIKNIDNADVFIVNRKPIDKKITYIHDFGNTVTWAVPSAADDAGMVSAAIILPFAILGEGLAGGRGSLPSSGSGNFHFNIVKFNADVFINGKNNIINARGSHDNSFSFSSDNRLLLRTSCDDFAKKLKSILIKNNAGKIIIPQSSGIGVVKKGK
ncbi:MAG: hypothetical protein EVJ47_03645 [Candidatus Acidulodesulfobacterium ferriphilum]|uniref:Lipoprotein n=1 Tax=Candidatus Acidulodesulfobacterium ferriphilum TaxID=2597223 RepID=A0A519BDN9_9DELT|nr:MAG: hypothetical protein EVJ47_03645 [Candidatus Acidulodesulfobacterium ferriphilum]